MVSTLTLYFSLMSAAFLSSWSLERAARTRLTPSEAKHCATARPMPFDAPVMSAVRPARCKSIGASLLLLSLRAHLCRSSQEGQSACPSLCAQRSQSPRKKAYQADNPVRHDIDAEDQQRPIDRPRCGFRNLVGEGRNELDEQGAEERA